MNDSSRGADDDIADAGSLFDAGAKARPSPEKRSAPREIPLEGYDMEGGEEVEERPAPVTRAPVAPKRPKAARPPIEDEDQDDEPRGRSSSASESAPASVEVVWSRWGEWGGTLLVLAAIVGGTLVLTYMVGNSLGIGPAFLVLLIGLAVAVAASYPIAITLERPVRMTPEQAVKDFFAAASHHFPHYRRMWLLLSDQGKRSREFDSFATFRSYWKYRMTKLRGASVKGTTPLAFDVTEFKGDKSAGKTSADATYKIVAGARGGAAIASARVSGTFVKGPDGQWYVNSGIWPEERPAGSKASVE